VEKSRPRATPACESIPAARIPEQPLVNKATATVPNRGNGVPLSFARRRKRANRFERPPGTRASIPKLADPSIL
jgi:hypothetical protein